MNPVANALTLLLRRMFEAYAEDVGAEAAAELAWSLADDLAVAPEDPA